MIISHQHRFLFVELPRTGSTAIRRELRELYDGSPILHKHATYLEFARQASADERTYFVFSGIRNPLDDAVSRYFKLKTDHKQRFSDPDQHQRRRSPLNSLLDRRMFEYLKRTDADFSTFFLHFYVLPYDTWASLSHEQFDHLIRFENLSEDFDTALRRIGIDPVRRLPHVNPTGQRARSFADYYSPAAIRRARRVMGPYMERWGYDFPESWHVPRPTRLHRLGYQGFSRVAQVYWRALRPRA
ncbi:MAG: sulfotransferase family 2 domain-containing protein [Chloroflexota bacterium]